MRLGRYCGVPDRERRSHARNIAVEQLFERSLYRLYGQFTARPYCRVDISHRRTVNSPHHGHDLVFQPAEQLDHGLCSARSGASRRWRGFALLIDPVYSCAPVLYIDKQGILIDHQRECYYLLHEGIHSAHPDRGLYARH
jgi:hypothetical protein